MKKRYRVVYAPDESGHWIARVPAVKGCHTYGLSIEQARKRIREALSLFVDGAETAELVDDVRLPSIIRRDIRFHRETRQLAERHQKRAGEALQKVARTLTGKLNLSVRDAGELLGVSHQRVQQVLSKPARRQAH